MSTKKTIATIIGVLLMFGCQFLPPVFGLTPLGMQVAGIFTPSQNDPFHYSMTPAPLQ